jgi:hypothetical protein
MIHDKRSLAEILYQHEQQLEGARSRTWVDASQDPRTETWVA